MFLAMTNLVTACQNNDINEFEKILKVVFLLIKSFRMYLFLQVNSQTIMEDTFIREHIEDLLRNIRTQVLIKLRRGELASQLHPEQHHHWQDRPGGGHSVGVEFSSLCPGFWSVGAE